MYDHIYIYTYIFIIHDCSETGEYSDVPCKSPKRQNRFNECTIILVGFYQLLSSSGGCYTDRPTIISLLSHHYPSIIPVKSCKITIYINSHLDAACSHHNPTRQQLSFPGTSEWQFAAFGGDISTIVSTQIDMIFTLGGTFF